jgi:Fe-S cluster assembly scaffold protein SufB
MTSTSPDDETVVAEINTENPGRFERTLIIAEEGSEVPCVEA